MELFQTLLYLICRATWFYSYLFLLVLTLYIPILLAYSCSRLGTKVHYLLWKAVLLYPIILLPGLFVPIFLLRPRSVMNARFTAWFIRKLSYIANLTWELRGANIAGMDQGAVICCNHQSAVDIFGEQNLLHECVMCANRYWVHFVIYKRLSYLWQAKSIYGSRLNL